MARFDNPLRRVRVAAPCTAGWERMRGDERVRFCEHCSLNVYNLSGMTRREAESLLSNAEGRLCVRFYRRKDGTILTDNCPVGLRALKRRVSRATSAVLSAVVSFFAGLGIVSGFDFYRSLNPEETKGTLAVDRGPALMGTAVVKREPTVGITPQAMGHVVVDDTGWVEGRAVGLPARPSHHRSKSR